MTRQSPLNRLVGDARQMLQDIQEAAYEEGLIPERGEWGQVELARAAAGVASLSKDAPVETEIIVQVRR